ncbi:hypothetical protein ACP4OV_000621 [Aristida adscensionis]
MTPQFVLAVVLVLCSSHLVSSIRRVSDNASQLGAYLVAVRRPDGLAGADEPEALERWHTSLLKQVCNASEPATAERFPTAESRLIYSYSHVVSGFSAWLTRQEVEEMAMHPWFVEAIPDKSYKLMARGTPASKHALSALGKIQGSVWDRGNMGEGMIIGILDSGAGAGAGAGHVPVIPEAEGMRSLPAKWKGRCDDESGACNKKLIGLRSFVDASRPNGTDKSTGNGASDLGVEYGTAFAVAPKAHLAIYHVCSEECDPRAVMAGMDAAVDDGVDVILMSIGSGGDAVFHDDAAMVPSYKAVSRGVLVCTAAGSTGPDMFEVESDAPWLLTVATSDTDRRALTNAHLGAGILKPDVSAPGLNANEGEENADTDLAEATATAAAHASGVAALIKKAHGEWSPAAIKSALVTTADPVGPGDALAGEGTSYFVTGAGEVNPVKAMDPGLVYDATADDFIPYLCSMNTTVELAHGACAETAEVAVKDLNYPSIMVAMDENVQQVEAKRTVTNVGDAAESYRAEAAVRGVDVAVNPSTLQFADVGQKLDFVVTVSRQPGTPAKAVIEGHLKLVSEKHTVRSPMVVVVGETAASSGGHSDVADVGILES